MPPVVRLPETPPPPILPLNPTLLLEGATTGGIKDIVVDCWVRGTIEAMGEVSYANGRVDLGGDPTTEVVSPMTSLTLCKFSLYFSCKCLLCLRIGCVFIH